MKHDGVEADDIRSPLLERIPAGFLENLDDFRSSLDKEDTFRPFGDQLSAFDHEIDAENKRFEIFKVVAMAWQFLRVIESPFKALSDLGQWPGINTGFLSIHWPLNLD